MAYEMNLQESKSEKSYDHTPIKYYILYYIKLTPKIFLWFVSLYYYSVITVTQLYFTIFIMQENIFKEKALYFRSLMVLSPCVFLKRSSTFSIWLDPTNYVAGPDPQVLPLIACLSLTESFNLCISAFSPLKWEWYLPFFIELMRN